MLKKYTQLKVAMIEHDVDEHLRRNAVRSFAWQTVPHIGYRDQPSARNGMGDGLGLFAGNAVMLAHKHAGRARDRRE